MDNERHEWEQSTPNAIHGDICVHYKAYRKTDGDTSGVLYSPYIVVLHPKIGGYYILFDEGCNFTMDLFNTPIQGPYSTLEAAKAIYELIDVSKDEYV